MITYKLLKHLLHNLQYLQEQSNPSPYRYSILIEKIHFDYLFYFFTHFNLKALNFQLKHFKYSFLPFKFPSHHHLLHKYIILLNIIKFYKLFMYHILLRVKLHILWLLYCLNPYYLLSYSIKKLLVKKS